MSLLDKMENNLERYGIIIFTSDMKNTIIVESRKGKYGFPKGHLEKGETPNECALRELFEETGITNNQIELSDMVFFEKNHQEKKVIGYYFAHPINDLELLNLPLKFNHTEINDAKWVKFDDFYQQILFDLDDKISNKRKNLCEDINKFIKKKLNDISR